MRRGRTRRRATGVGLVVAAATALGACTSGPDDAPSGSRDDAPRAVTQDEADRLAVARFNVYDQHYVDLVATVPVEGQTLRLDGTADTQAHAASARVESSDGQHALLQWTLAAKALYPVGAADDPGLDPADLPDPTALPADGWTVAGLGPDDPLDAALVVILNLASDRPENAQLLRQNGAQRVGTQEIDGTAVDVFTAPAATGGSDDRVRWFVDDQGVLHRVEADVGRDVPLVVDLTPSQATEVPVIDALVEP